ncbi:MAG: hypothetical protein MSS51_09105 [Bacteroidales bacterium]|nr:hypothetical protein [Bacteroidales bacterium]
MTMAEGWIKLHRKITEWEWYKSPSVRCIFMHLLLTANTKDGRYKGHVIKRGQRLTSVNILARENGLSAATVKRTLKRLEETGEIKKEHFMNGSLITVIRFGEYQDIEYLTQPMTQPMTHNLRIKEYKNTRIPPPPPPAREENSEKRFYEALKGSVEMMNVMRDEYGMTPDKYWGLLASFDRECTAKSKRHTSTEDYKRHFYDWTRRHIEINGKDGDKNKGKGYGNSKPGSGQEHGGDNLSPKDRAIREANRRDRIAMGLDPDPEPTAYGSDFEF